VSKGGFLKFLGFALPFEVSDVGGDAPRDRLPVRGVCHLCKRERTRTYLRGDGNRICELDIEATVHSRRVQSVRAHRRKAEYGGSTNETVPAEPWIGEDAVWWDSKFI